MAYLNWISDESLTNAVLHLFDIAVEAEVKAEKQFYRNVIDPFSAMFEITGFKTDYSEWLINEKRRKSQKTLQNHIGEFHQIILGSVESWENLRVGKQVDLVSDDLKLLAEIKNKHNTVKKDTLGALYEEMEQMVMPKSSRYKGYTIYYVTIIPDKPQRFDMPFTPSNKKTGTKFSENEKIRMIDGASFYDLVANSRNALEDLYNCLPNVIADCNGFNLKPSERSALKNFFSLAYG